MNENPFQMTEALRPAATELIQEQFNPGRLILLEGKRTKTDYLAHIDLICSSSSVRRYLDISDRPILETQTMGIDWKRASYPNWTKFPTATFNESLLDHGQNIVTIWLYEDESGTEVRGWIAALWNQGLARQLVAEWTRYQARALVHKNTKEGKDFWFIYLENLTNFFRGFILGHDLRCFSPEANLPDFKRGISSRVMRCK